MKDTLFVRKKCYKSSLKPKEIQDKLLSLIKGDIETEDSFTGKGSNLKFSLTPILGPRQGWKLLMLGKVREDAETIVEIIYTVDSFLKGVIYSLCSLYSILFIICRVTNYNLIILKFEHFDYLLAAASLIVLIACKITFNNQYYYYSQFIKRFLNLEITECNKHSD